MSFTRLAREEALGRYRLIARLGRGGMAEVFLARLVGAGGFEKLVAIKRMLPMLSDDAAFVDMFLEEGRIAAQLDHPNVCHVYELDDADGTLYLAMEFLRGLPWSEVVPAIPDRPRATLTRFVTGAIAQACEGLHHAHSAVGADGQPRSIVHRDVSPSNLFVTHEGIVKLLDFGVSKVLTEATGSSVGTRKGKLPYMAPEQMRGQPVDVRADIFSVAVVTWEALAGHALFDRTSDYETMMAVARTEIPALPDDDPVFAALDAVLRRALAHDRAQRHGSARELAHDLRQAIAAHGEPMTPGELGAHVAAWLGPSLARRSRDLAEIVGRRPEAEERTGEHTAIHTPPPVAGARLRDVSVVVGEGALEAADTTEPVLAASSVATFPDPVPAPTIEPGRIPQASGPHAETHRAPGLRSLAARRAGPVLVAAAGIVAVAIITTWVFLHDVVVPGAASSIPGGGPEPGTPSPAPAATANGPATPAALPAPAAPPAPTAPPAPRSSGPSSSDAAALYERADYAGVVQACSQKISAEIARLCVLAACQQRNAARAMQWRVLVRSTAERQKLTAACRKLGKGAVELAPALDCARNPLDCR